jgi:hypothetical protein
MFPVGDPNFLSGIHVDSHQEIVRYGEKVFFKAQKQSASACCPNQFRWFFEIITAK